MLTVTAKNTWSSTCLMVLLVLLANTKPTQGSWSIPDRYCVGNFGCETDFQDMIFNVSKNFVTARGSKPSFVRVVPL